MKPTIGHIVHYQSRGSKDGVFEPLPRAAIVTEVDDISGTMVGLAVLNPTGFFFDRDVPFSEEPKPGHWSWPPRV
jgi:hypothetical protein